MTFQCSFCNKEFQKETSIAVHACEIKRRHQEQKEVGVQIGLQAFLKFYEHAQGSAKLKTFNDFATSAYYRAFVKFGRYCVSTKVINPSQFMIWLLKNKKRIDQWCKDGFYTDYLVGYLLLEHHSDAMARSIETAISWAEQSSSRACDFLRYANENFLCHCITTGKVSAWVLYNCDSGQQLLSKFNSDQVAMIWQYIDSDAWQKKFQNFPADVEYTKEILSQMGW